MRLLHPRSNRLYFEDYFKIYYKSLLKEMLPAQELRGPLIKNEPAFFRRLKQSMDVVR